MKCARVRLPGGAVAIVCGRGQRVTPCQCGAFAPFLCDWKVTGGRTCDKPICDAHAFEAAPEKHICPRHQLAYRRYLAGLCVPLQ